MDNFDLRKYLAENRLFEEEASTYQKIWDFSKKSEPKVRQTLRNAARFSGKTLTLVKKEFNKENAEKGLKVAKDLYTGLKGLVDKATSDPEKIKQISKFIPTIKNSFVGSVVLGAYQIVTGTSANWQNITLFGMDTGIDKFGGMNWGNPDTAITIFAILASLKLIMYALQTIASIRKGIGAAKDIFSLEETDNLNENDIDFKDIEALVNKIK